MGLENLTYAIDWEAVERGDDVAVSEALRHLNNLLNALASSRGLVPASLQSGGDGTFTGDVTARYPVQAAPLVQPVKIGHVVGNTASSSAGIQMGDDGISFSFFVNKLSPVSGDNVLSVYSSEYTEGFTLAYWSTTDGKFHVLPGFASSASDMEKFQLGGDFTTARQLPNANIGTVTLNDLVVRSGGSINEQGRTHNLGEWTTYTPTWSATTTNPTIGNGTLSGRYTIVGNTVFFQTTIVWGSTSTAGSGVWILTAPSTPTSAISGVVTITDSGTGNYYGVPLSAGSGSYVMSIPQGLTAAAGVTDSVPITWATGDVVQVTGWYEIS